MAKSHWKISASGTGATPLNGLLVIQDTTPTNWELKTAPPQPTLLASSSSTPPSFNFSLSGSSAVWTLTVTNTTSPISGSWSNNSGESGSWSSVVYARYRIREAGPNSQKDATDLVGFVIEQVGANYSLETIPPHSNPVLATFSAGPPPSLTNITLPGAAADTNPWRLTINNTTSPISGTWSNADSSLVNESGQWSTDVINPEEEEGEAEAACS